FHAPTILSFRSEPPQPARAAITKTDSHHFHIGAILLGLDQIHLHRGSARPLTESDMAGIGVHGYLGLLLRLLLGIAYREIDIVVVQHPFSRLALAPEGAANDDGAVILELKSTRVLALLDHCSRLRIAHHLVQQGGFHG